MTARSAAGDGIANAASRHLARNWGWVLLRGVLAVIGGALALLWPGLALLSLVLLFAAYMIADGASGIAAAIRAARRHERWGWLVAEGLLGIVAGLLALVLPTAAIFSSSCWRARGRSSRGRCSSPRRYVSTARTGAG